MEYPFCYLIIIHNPKLRIKKTIFTKENVSMYLPILTFSFAINLNEIRLAIDAIKVPSPPRFTPISKSLAFSVNFERRIAAGTFENTWLEITPTITSLLFTTLFKKSLMGLISPRLPIKINKKTKKLIKMEYSYKYVVSYKILYSNF